MLYTNKVATTYFPFVVWSTVAVSGISQGCCLWDNGSSISNCQCIGDNVELNELTIELAEKKYFHWRLTNFSLVNLPDAARPNITFTVAPCTGSVEIYVVPVSSPAVLSTESAIHKSTRVREINTIKLPLFHSDYYITVYGRSTASFTFLSTVDDSLFPSPGNNGVLILNQTLQYDVQVTWFSPQAYVGTLVYTIYYVHEKQPPVCTNVSNISCPLPFILWTPCGLELEPLVAKLSFSQSKISPASTRLSVVIHDLPLERPFFFNVVVKTEKGLRMAYGGARSRLEFDRVITMVDHENISAVLCAHLVVIVITIAGIYISNCGLNAFLLFERNGDTRHGKKLGIVTFRTESSDDGENYMTQEDDISGDQSAVKTPRNNTQVFLDSLLNDTDPSFSK